jgi:hypothetical protein
MKHRIVGRYAVVLPEQRHVLQNLEHGLTRGLVGALQLDDDEVADLVLGQNVNEALRARVVRQLVVHFHQRQAGLKHVELLGQPVANVAFLGHAESPGINQ